MEKMGFVPIFNGIDMRFAITGPPSEPTNLTFRLNQTSVNLFWGPPLNAGGRTDITYR